MRKILAINLLLGIFCLNSCKKVENTETRSSQKKVNSVKLLSWSEYFDPDALDEFTEKTGLEVDYITYDDMKNIYYNHYHELNHEQQVLVKERCLKLGIKSKNHMAL